MGMDPAMMAAMAGGGAQNGPVPPDAFPPAVAGHKRVKSRKKGHKGKKRRHPAGHRRARR
jgi:hypothetical protein